MKKHVNDLKIKSTKLEHQAKNNAERYKTW
ncbi:hypothetical protein HNQ59_001859 [Chitinivorax tropicus]|uniref:Uncharacterized protein n=1 Tax=Chitinivorax tropicus TaxID=714531 RepID=A0A840MJI4_9PROT|nr:hypothetical protein [Chitinivorax tropicus]